MNKFYILLCTVLVGAAYSCSGETENSFGPAGGTGSGSTGSGGASYELPTGFGGNPWVGGLSATSTGTIAEGEASPLFGTLGPVECAAEDPCCSAIIWQTAVPLQNIEPPMTTGAYVVQDNDKHLYKYIGTQEIDWPLEGCAPTNPTLGHCNGGQWWQDMQQVCP